MQKQTALKILSAGVALMLMSANANAANNLVACGDDELRFYEVAATSLREVDRVKWNAFTVPEQFSGLERFTGFVECKPAKSGRELLITSWMGAVAKVDIATRTVNFSTNVPSAHSADILPNDRIVVVGDYLRVFSESDGSRAIYEQTLDDGHGVVWDANRQRLYVLSQDYINEFELADWNSQSPALRETRQIELPGKGDGHDLFLAADGQYIVSTFDGVWDFDPENGKFTSFPELNPLHRAQSVGLSDGNLVWVQAEESWWGRGFFVRLSGNPVQRISTPDIRMYKARWLPREVLVK